MVMEAESGRDSACAIPTPEELAAEHRLLGDNVLVRACEEKQRGKIVVVTNQDSADKPRLFRGEVLSVGPGRVTEFGHPVPMTVEPGDYIRFAPGTVLPFDMRSECITIKARDIIAVEIKPDGPPPSATDNGPASEGQ